MKRFVLSASVFLIAAGLGLAEFTPRDGPPKGGEVRAVHTAREMPAGKPAPRWENPRPFAKDVFTFVRLHYASGRGGTGPPGTEDWETDAPESDLNFSYRLQQMTSLKVDPDGRVVELTDPELTRFPWLYVVEPGALYFTPEEVLALRNYLNNGGFVMFDDFWGDAAWKNLEYYMRKVLPGKRFVEMPLDHPLYHCVFEITSKGQVPNTGTGADSEFTGITYETNHDGDVKTVHHRGIFDDNGRLMVLATHNTDNGDGWEGEGENEYFFRTFSERISYPLGINLVFYVMTH